MNTKRMTRLSLLLSMAMILAYLETFIPPLLPIPGMKLGLANMVVLTVLLIYGPKEAFIISLLRVFLFSSLFGLFLTPGFFVSLSGALFSLSMMSLLRHSPLSPIGLSILGAAGHNTGQLLAAWIYLGTTNVFYLWPWSLLWSIPFGFVTGLIVFTVLSHRPLQVFLFRK